MRKNTIQQSNESNFEDIDFSVPEHRSLCLYLSSGLGHIKYIINLDHDLFIFNDCLVFLGSEYVQCSHAARSIRTDKIWELILADFNKDGESIELSKLNDKYIYFKYKEKHIALFFDDNNTLVNRLRNANLVISTIIGINDGCNEGGNYECINKESFLVGLSPIMSTTVNYIIDHSYPLERTVYARGCSNNPKFREQLKLNDTLQFDLQAVLVYVDEDKSDTNKTVEKKNNTRAYIKNHDKNTQTEKSKLTILAFAETDTVILERLKPIREMFSTPRLALYKVTKLPSLQTNK